MGKGSVGGGACFGCVLSFMGFSFSEDAHDVQCAFLERSLWVSCRGWLGLGFAG
jgi:hypothetical protein